MGIFKANPEAEVSVGFEVVRAGTYRMRIKTVEDRNSLGKNDLKICLEHTEPKESLVNSKGEALKGQAGGIFDYIMLAPDKQWKLRTLTEAVGMAWSDYDPLVELPGKEVEVVVKVEPYEGLDTNKVARYVIKK